MSSKLSENISTSDKNHQLVKSLVREIQDEGQYLVELQRRHLESVFDDYKTMITGWEITETLASIKKKDFLLKTMYRLDSYKECLKQ